MLFPKVRAELPLHVRMLWFSDQGMFERSDLIAVQGRRAEKGTVHNYETIVHLAGVSEGIKLFTLVSEFNPVVLEMIQEGSLVLPQDLGVVQLYQNHAGNWWNDQIRDTVLTSVGCTE